uniref:Uncharacterized protein n=1 Tax=Cairina moschata TaxID=8855 RepID=A0A8C3GKS7_CAIMO
MTKNITVLNRARQRKLSTQISTSAMKETDSSHRNTYSLLAPAPAMKNLSLELLRYFSKGHAHLCTNTRPTHPGLQLLDLLLASFQGQLLSLIQTVLQVLHCLVQVLLHSFQVSTSVSLHLLLQPQGFVPAPDLSIQGALHGLHNSEVISLQLVNFLIFLCYLPVNLRLDLVELKLDAKDLSFFMFQGGLYRNECKLNTYVKNIEPLALSKAKCNVSDDISTVL